MQGYPGNCSLFVRRSDACAFQTNGGSRSSLVHTTVSTFLQQWTDLDWRMHADLGLEIVPILDLIRSMQVQTELDARKSNVSMATLLGGTRRCDMNSSSHHPYDWPSAGSGYCQFGRPL